MPTEANPEWDGRESFSRVNPFLQIAWDSTSLGALKKCPRYYQLSIVEGWRLTPRYGWKSNTLHLRFGHLYHRALEYYDHMKSAGWNHDDAMALAIVDMVHGCVDKHEVEGETFYEVWNPNGELDEDKAKLNSKTVPTLIRTVVWFLERFGEKDPATTLQLANGKPAVELSFRFEAGFKTQSTNEPVLLSGHLDRLAEYAGGNYVMDRKTSKNALTSRYFEAYNPHNQMSLYSIAGRVVGEAQISGVIIDAVQITKGASSFERGITPRTAGSLDEWLVDFKHYVQLAEIYAAERYWPMNDTACDNYGGCTFRRICSRDPRVRSAFLKTDFHIEAWDPLRVRGDLEHE